MADGDRLAQYERLKSEGNDKYKAKQYDAAKALYTSAIMVKPDEPVAYSNRAACHIQTQHWYHALHDCNKALEIDPKFGKAYFRRATALRELFRYKVAMEDYLEVIKLDGENKAASKEIEVIKKILEGDMRMILKPTEKPEEFRSKKPMQRFALDNHYSGTKQYDLTAV